MSRDARKRPTGAHRAALGSTQRHHVEICRGDFKNPYAFEFFIRKLGVSRAQSKLVSSLELYPNITGMTFSKKPE